MKKMMLILCCAVLMFALLASQPAWAATKLDGPAIKELLSGKIVNGISGKDNEFTKIYSTDGTFTLEVNGVTSTGKWWIKGDDYCQQRGVREEECFKVQSGEKNKDGINTYRMLDKSSNQHTIFWVP